MLKFFKNKIFIIIIVIAVGLQIYTQSQDGAEEREMLFESCPVHYDMSNIPQNIKEYSKLEPIWKKELYAERKTHFNNNRYYVKDLKSKDLWFNGYIELESAKRLKDNIGNDNKASFLGSTRNSYDIYFGQNGKLLFIKTSDYKINFGNFYCRYDSKGDLFELSSMNDNGYYTFNKQGKKIFHCSTMSDCNPF